MVYLLCVFSYRTNKYKEVNPYFKEGACMEAATSNISSYVNIVDAKKY